MSDRSSSPNSTLLVPPVVSFVAGVASAGLVYWVSLRIQNSKDDSGDTKQSFVRWMSMDDIASRIGEMPSLPRRSRWPWDRRKKIPEDDLAENIDHNDRADPTQEPEQSRSINKSGLCIGSIFGFDVGGTLGKLAYFETTEQAADESIGRERSYRAKASAQTVIMARRGLETASDHPQQQQNSHFREDAMKRRASEPRIERRRRSKSHSCASTMWGDTDRTTIPHPQPLRRQHSTASNEDLSNLYSMRQKSVPDDLHAYAKNAPSTFRNPTKAPTEASKAFMNGKSPAMPARSGGGGMRKVHSMFDLSKNRDHAEALDRFYNFARRLDSYREGVKDHQLSFYSSLLGGEFHFIRFETRRMQNAMDLIRANKLHLNIREMGATGGGAHKFAAQWKQELGIEMKKQDELDSLVAGMQFVLSTVVGECYTFRPRDPSSSMSTSMDSSRDSDLPDDDNDVGICLEDEEEEDSPADSGKGDEWWWSRKVQRDSISNSSTYPYLVVTIGTGVSVLRVDGPRKYERVSGSTIGGGTYLGLMRLLTDGEDFEDIMRLAERGDPSKVDMLVGDIYGKNSEALEKLGLPANLVASSFGKLVAKEDPAAGLKQEDLARALLLMITNNIGQVAYLNAKLVKTPRIYFVGNFLRHNKISQRRLSYAINYWSGGEMEALYLEHEGYFGALGAFLLAQKIPCPGSGAGQRRYQPPRSSPMQQDHTEPEPSHRRRKTLAVPYK